MITRLEVDGFKSFYQFEMDLSPFQVIVGPNAAGKSNLFDVLKLLARLAEVDLRTAFQEVRGESGELFTILPNGKTTDLMRFAVELLLERSVTDQWGRSEELRQTRVRYELHIRRDIDAKGYEQLRVSYESLLPLRAKEDQWATGRKEGAWKEYFQYNRPHAAFISCGNVDGKPTLTLHQDGRAGRQRQSVLDRLGSTLLSSLNNAEFPHGFAVREEIRNWTFLQLNPDALRTPTSRLAPDRMDASGQYLANTLARLQSTEEFILQDVSARLSSLVPGIVQVEIEDDTPRDRFVVWARTSDGRRFSSRVLSDGTLRLLALVTILFDPLQGGVLMFEEPENGVHPYRVKQVVPLLREMTTRFDELPVDGHLRQLLVNTHSPQLVSYLYDSEIVFANVAEVVVPGQANPMRVTQMIPVRNTLLPSHGYFLRSEIEKYLDRSDLEAAVGRFVRDAR